MIQFLRGDRRSLQEANPTVADGQPVVIQNKFGQCCGLTIGNGSLYMDTPGLGTDRVLEADMTRDLTSSDVATVAFDSSSGWVNDSAVDPFVIRYRGFLWLRFSVKKENVSVPHNVREQIFNISWTGVSFDDGFAYLNLVEEFAANSDKRSQTVYVPDSTGNMGTIVLLSYESTPKSITVYVDALGRTDAGSTNGVTTLPSLELSICHFLGPAKHFGKGVVGPTK